MGRIGKTLKVFLISILTLFILFVGSLQTPAVKNLIGLTIEAIAKKQGIDLTIQTISGAPPFKWIVEGVVVKWGEGNQIYLNRAQLRVAFLPLLRKEISFSYIHADQVQLRLSEEQNVPQATLDWEALPFSLAINALKVSSIQVENGAVYSLFSKGELDKAFNDFTLSLKLETSNLSFCELFASGSKKTNELTTRLKMKVDSKKDFAPFFQFPVDSAFSLDLRLSGEWNTWIAALSHKKMESSPLKGDLKAELDKLDWLNLHSLNTRWKIDSHFLWYTSGSFDLSQLRIESPLLYLHGRGQLDETLHLKSSDLLFQIPDLAVFTQDLPIPLAGKFDGEFHYNPALFYLTFSSSALIVGNQNIKQVEGMVKGICDKNVWKGNAEASVKNEQTPLHLVADFTSDEIKTTVAELTITAPESTIGGNFTYWKGQGDFVGSLMLNVNNLKQFDSWQPNSLLSGSAGGELYFHRHGGKEALHCQLTLQDFRYHNLAVSDISLSAEIEDWAENPKGKISIGGTHLYLPDLHLSSVQAFTYWKNGVWPFEITALGLWRNPLDVHCTGQWKKEKNHLEVTFTELQGNLLQRDLDLKEPCTIRYTPDERLQINPCQLHLGEGYFFITSDLGEKTGTLEVRAQHFPLDFLTLYNPHVSLSGLCGVDISLKVDDRGVDGWANAVLERAMMKQQGKKEPVAAKGTIQLNFSRDILQVHSLIKATGDQFFDWSATLPISFELFPFSFQIKNQEPISSSLTMDGKVEELFDFVNLGSNTATGRVSSKLFLSRTLASPSFQGIIDIEDGSYENYLSGTALRDISARMQAENQRLNLLSFSAHDMKEGTVTATGEIRLEPAKKFPYHFDTKLDNLNTVRFDTISANLTGPLTISGNGDGALAKGHLEVASAEFRIPDKLPVDLPILPITFINEPIGLKNRSLEGLNIFPFQYDLNLHAPQKVSVSGKGLTSEWQGDVHVAGTNMNVSASGHFSLIKGEYAFAGKVFTLTQGEIVMNSKPTQGAFLTLSGTLELGDVTVTAMLRGPISAPQLTFQSMPHLPTSAILSRILFNKDISEIDPFQAIQLAQTLVTLSGGAAPDVLEKIRKTLGVDRLTIVSATPGEDNISVQIGKYLTKGVMVTLSQSTNSSNVIVEIELAKGFIFQAETQQDQEGKFTLKWNRNY